MHRAQICLILAFTLFCLIAGPVQCLAQEKKTVRHHPGFAQETELGSAFPLAGSTPEPASGDAAEIQQQESILEANATVQEQTTGSHELREPVADKIVKHSEPDVAPTPLDTSKLTQAGVVESIEGAATALLDISETQSHPRELVEGAAVYVQDLVHTGPEGKVMIRFLDESTLEMGPESEMRIGALSFDPGNASNSSQILAFLKGLLRFATGKITAQRAENLSVSSPLATIGIRGTITDHKIDVSEEEIDGTPVRVVNSELHALRETTASKVVVRSKEGEVVLDKPDMVAEVQLDIPMRARELTSFEKQEFGAVAIQPRSFDPEVNRKLYRGVGRPLN